MAINFNTDKITLVNYPPGSGGKFLINCCALSNRAVFQDEKLATLKLRNQLPINDKINLLINRIDSLKVGNWNDLGMGCGELFGDALFDYTNVDAYTNVIHPLSNGDDVFFKVTHTDVFAKQWKSQWKNAMVINFTNCNEFISSVRRETSSNALAYRKTSYWDAIRDKSWQLNPPNTFDEYEKLPSYIKEDITEINRGELLGYLHNDEKVVFDNSFEWDAKWLLNIDDALYNINRVYAYLGLNDFEHNIDNIALFYNKWFKHITL
jgi:hypothetical protein